LLRSLTPPQSLSPPRNGRQGMAMPALSKADHCGYGKRASRAENLVPVP